MRIKCALGRILKANSINQLLIPRRNHSHRAVACSIQDTAYQPFLSFSSKKSNIVWKGSNKCPFTKYNQNGNVKNYCTSVEEGKTQYTVQACLHDLKLLFEQSEVSEPEASAKYIIAHVLGHKTFHSVNLCGTVDATAQKEIRTLSDKRLSGWPVQYVLGEWDFHDMSLRCRPPVFIPRPETEELVSLALKDHNLQKATHGIEIGPGTGAVSLSLLTNLRQLYMSAIDVSKEACKLCKENAENIGLEDRLTVIPGEFTAKKFRYARFTQRFDFLISNPPYIPSQDIENLQPEIKLHEDRTALDGGEDGLNVIRDILQVAAQMIRPGGSIWLEVDSSHPEKIATTIAENPEYNLIYLNTYMDFLSKPRFCHLRVESR